MCKTIKIANPRPKPATNMTDIKNSDRYFEVCSIVSNVYTVWSILFFIYCAVKGFNIGKLNYTLSDNKVPICPTIP